MNEPTKDRGYCRSLPLRDLIERGLSSDSELALVLAERALEEKDEASSAGELQSVKFKLYAEEQKTEKLQSVLRGITVTIQNALITKP